MSNQRRSRLARNTRNTINNAVTAHNVAINAPANSKVSDGMMSAIASDVRRSKNGDFSRTGIAHPFALIKRGNQLVKVVEALIAHKSVGYCSFCEQNLYSTIGKTCCDECGSSCNLQGGCGSDCRQGCAVGNHEYSELHCPKCGHTCCWSCSVRCTDDSTGEEVFSCPSCGHTDHHPEIKE